MRFVQLYELRRNEIKQFVTTLFAGDLNGEALAQQFDSIDGAAGARAVVSLVERKKDRMYT